MRISQEQMEWATVDRMRDMLVNVHEDYKVTHTYALFTAILCWVMQRIRSQGHSALDRRARSVLAVLENEEISDAPWDIWTRRDQVREPGVRRPGPFTDFDGFNAARFLIALRNATSHGDARNIRPVNKNDFLVGHEFRCSEKYRRGRITWQGRIILDRRDMRRIGTAVADRFCAALSERANQPAHDRFEADARNLPEEEAA